MAFADQFPAEIFGVDLKAGDGKVVPPVVVRQDTGMDEWFKSMPTEPTVAIRILCVRLRPDLSCTPAALAQLLKTPMLDGIVDHAVWGSQIYRSLVENPGGGAVSLLDEPWRFILRTPDDGGPFCSFAASNHRSLVKAIFLFNADEFNPSLITGEQTRSGWRSKGLQMVSLAHMFVRAQSSLFSSPDLAEVIRQVKAIEDTLEVATELPRKYPQMNRTLHHCGRKLVDIERRSRFEQTALDAIEALVVESTFGTAPWPIIQPERMSAGARAYDFTSLPRRIENARATITGLVQQRSEELNTELAISSERIAEASFADSKSMKTIAILTMVFLPGTAVASLFSMSMFDWGSTASGDIASKWLWIYFVVAVPLTAIVLGVWWMWGARLEEQARRIYAARERRRQQRYIHLEDGDDGDLEAGGHAPPVDEADEIELQTANMEGKTIEV